MILVNNVATVFRKSLSSSLCNKALSKVQLCSGSGSSSKEMPKNVLEGVVSAHKQPGNGVVYDKKPFKITLEAGKRYSWCLCGHSHRQPFCDGTHKNQQLKITLKPVAFKVEKDEEYWLCNCKHTQHRPFCDGTHKQPLVQEATSIIKQ